MIVEVEKAQKKSKQESIAEAHHGVQSFWSDFKASDKQLQGKTVKWTI